MPELVEARARPGSKLKQDKVLTEAIMPPC